MISAPTDFKHVSHVGYNPKTGFSVDNIPLEWNAIFAKAGITADQLADRKTAKFLQKFMKQAQLPTSSTSPSTSPTFETIFRRRDNATPHHAPSFHRKRGHRFYGETGTTMV
ncbi:P21-Rho-binding domain-containing protein [Chytridium lagenaria]|nr:P21-Rho-binding domain-containing protein [Chytridium lagenaria]